MLEGGHTLEDGREEEIKQSPHFREVVLEGGTREQETLGGDVILVEDLRELAMVVLHSVTLVNYHVLPTNLEDIKRNNVRCIQFVVDKEFY